MIAAPRIAAMKLVSSANARPIRSVTGRRGRRSAAYRRSSSAQHDERKSYAGRDRLQIESIPLRMSLRRMIPDQARDKPLRRSDIALPNHAPARRGRPRFMLCQSDATQKKRLAGTGAATGSSLFVQRTSHQLVFTSTACATNFGSWQGVTSRLQRFRRTSG